MSANYWTAAGAGYHGKINSQCTNRIDKVNIKKIIF